PVAARVSPAVVHLFGPAEDPRELDDLAARGAEAAGPVPEALVGGGGEDAEIHARRLVVGRREDGIQTAAADAPRMPPVGDVVLPVQLGADLVQSSVDDERVLGRPGAVGPLRTDLDADRAAVR